MSKVINIHKNSFVYMQNEKSEYVYILQKGSLCQEETSCITGEVSRIDISEGSFFGITDTVANCPRTASVVALKDSVCVELTPAEFEKLVLPQENILKSIVKDFASNIRKSFSTVSSGVDFQNLESDRMILGISSGFYNLGNYTAAFEVINRCKKTFPELGENPEIKNIYENSKDKLNRNDSDSSSALEQFIKSNYGMVKKSDIGFTATFKNLVQVYDNGEVIRAEGEKDETIFYLESGTVLMYKFTGNGIALAGVAMPGDFFGELPVTDGGNREVTCVAFGYVKVLEFSKENFDKIFTLNSHVAYNLIKQMGRKTIFIKEYIRILKLGTEREKIASIFKLLSIIDENSKNIDLSAVVKKGMGVISSKSRMFRVSKMLISMTLGIPLQNLEDRLCFLKKQMKIDLLEGDVIVIYDIDNLN